MSRPKVLLADDHAIFLEGLCRILEDNFDVIGTAADGRSLLKALGKLSPDVIVADISMPALNGIEAARQIKKADPRAKIIFLTMHHDALYAAAAFRAGASGYVVKDTAASELQTAIRHVLSGRTYMTPYVADGVLQSFTNESQEPEIGVKLTAREREVLQLVAEGHAVKSIAAILGISPRTVEFHKYRIMEKLGVHSIAELAVWAGTASSLLNQGPATHTYTQ